MNIKQFIDAQDWTLSIIGGAVTGGASQMPIIGILTGVLMMFLSAYKAYRDVKRIDEKAESEDKRADLKFREELQQVREMFDLEKEKMKIEIEQMRQTLTPEQLDEINNPKLEDISKNDIIKDLSLIHI